MVSKSVEPWIIRIGKPLTSDTIEAIAISFALRSTSSFSSSLNGFSETCVLGVFTCLTASKGVGGA